jgi:hypothetical protein
VRVVAGPVTSVPPPPPAPVTITTATASVAPPTTTTVTVTPEPATTTVVPQAAPLTPRPAPRAAAPRASSQGLADARFFGELGSGIIVSDRAAAIAGAHDACMYMAAGHTPYETVQVTMGNNPSLTWDNAWTFVLAATHAYCPEQAR